MKPDFSFWPRRMQTPCRPVRWLAVVLFVAVIPGQCQQVERWDVSLCPSCRDKVVWSRIKTWTSPVPFIPTSCSRRSVSEHQLMHDRSRNIQSLKRLIWLSSAIEGLHTAETRSAPLEATRGLNVALSPALISAAGSPQTSRVQNLLRDFFSPNVIQVPDREPDY